MLVLDTDHLTALERHGHSTSLFSRLDESLEPLAVTIVTIEEQLRGWLAEIHRRNKDVYDQIAIYRRLETNLAFTASLQTLGWSETAAGIFTDRRRQKIRIGSMDLKIASIAIANDALLLSANLRDFESVPGLRVENWLLG